MSHKIRTVALFSLLSVVIARPNMQAKEVLDFLGHKELASYFDANFDQDAGPTLSALMYSGQSSDDWPKAATEVALFLSKFRQVADKSSIKGDSTIFNASSPLYDWLQSLGSSKDAYVNILPERVRQHYSGSADDFVKRSEEAMNLLKRQDFVCLQNLQTRNMKSASGQLRLNAKNVQGRLGPDSLDAAIFMSDLLVNYYKQMGVVEHGTQYRTVETAQKFGLALDDELGRQGLDADGRKRYWSNVSLLTGWEFIRRYVTKDNVDEILARGQHDPSSVVECGLRLINNERITSPVFMINVALALPT